MDSILISRVLLVLIKYNFSLKQFEKIVKLTVKSLTDSNQNRKSVKTLIQIKIENQSDKAYDLFLEEFEKLAKLADLFQTNGIFVRLFK